MANKSSTVQKAVRKTGKTQPVNKQVHAKQAKIQTVSKRGSAKRAAISKSDQVDIKRQLKIQKALYEIADAASAGKDMQSFYKRLHKIVGKLMYAENFFIAIYDEETDLISWPYFVDSTGDQAPAPASLKEFKGGTAYVLRTGQIVHASRAQSEELYRQGAVVQSGPES